MPRYAFCCRSCGLEFEVSRSMGDAGREAACPVDGGGSDRVFTAPMTSVRQGEPAASARAPAAEGATRSWSSPFFPKSVPSEERPRPTTPPRHVLPPGSSKPTRFRHFGHWHPAGTPAHTHPPRRPPPSKPEPRNGA
jgi:putative FmdB family regulatory protein